MKKHQKHLISTCTVKTGTSSSTWGWFGLTIGTVDPCPARSTQTFVGTIRVNTLGSITTRVGQQTLINVWKISNI